jgi:beta-N-acetylhexosaminidase
MFKNQLSKLTFVFICLGLLVSLKSKPTTVSNIKTKSKPAFIDAGDLWAEKVLNSMTLEEKVGQFFMVATWSEKDETHQADIEKIIRENKIGGLIYFQGDKSNLKTSISRMQNASKVPLLIGMDAEWGVAMRLEKEERFPFAYTIGAANDVSLTEKIAESMAQECKDFGIHINFAPDADVNSNPNNPVIGFRSFGEDSKNVAEHVAAFVKGMEAEGVMTSIKHFPGHGDTDKDSHFELPTVSHTKAHFFSTDFPPFKAGIKAGTSSVMIGHLNVPSLDNSGTPSSLSKKIIQGYLQDSLGFKGLVISDALNMKAVADKYGKTEVVVKAFEAGCDILLYPESVSESIDAIVSKVKSGKISEKEINARCLKVLKAKHHAIFRAKTAPKYTEGEVNWIKKQVYEKSLTAIKNEDAVLPLIKTEQKVALVCLGSNTITYQSMAQNFNPHDQFQFEDADEAIKALGAKLNQYDVIVTSIHASSVRSVKGYGMPDKWQNWLEQLPEQAKNVLILFGNPFAFANSAIIEKQDAVVLAYENHPLAQDRTAQFLFGAIGANGKMHFQISDFLKKGKGLNVKSVNRLKYSQPEELGISAKKLEEIDQIALNGVAKGAFPGCQVLVAVEGKIIYQKSFGTKTYEGNDTVNNRDIYDIASVSKIAGSTAALMKLETQGKFTLNKKLEDYIPEVTGKGPFGKIFIKDMMAHQAGLTPWIPFYKKTVTNGKLNPAIYSTEKKEGFELQVAKDIWISNSYPDTLYKRILNSGLNSVKKYEYSDLGYYFVKKIIEKQTDQTLDNYLYSELYNPMGLLNIRYTPLNYFAFDRIVPTENDKDFRGQVIRGHVHDPGAAMFGGVGGHAGVFANSADLAAIMQLFLNKGNYMGKQLIDQNVIAAYTKAQFTGNRRGAGFDRPTPSAKGGPTSELVSQESYGHSGFTGTFTWADPAYGINYVFLSNRVYPSAENWKIRDMNIRTEIQRVIYQAIKK